MVSDFIELIMSEVKPRIQLILRRLDYLQEVSFNSLKNFSGKFTFSAIS